MLAMDRERKQSWVRDDKEELWSWRQSVAPISRRRIPTTYGRGSRREIRSASLWQQVLLQPISPICWGRKAECRGSRDTRTISKGRETPRCRIDGIKGRGDA